MEISIRWNHRIIFEMEKPIIVLLLFHPSRKQSIDRISSAKESVAICVEFLGDPFVISDKHNRLRRSIDRTALTRVIHFRILINSIAYDLSRLPRSLSQLKFADIREVRVGQIFSRQPAHQSELLLFTQLESTRDTDAPKNRPTCRYRFVRVFSSNRQTRISDRRGSLC